MFVWFNTFSASIFSPSIEEDDSEMDMEVMNFDEDFESQDIMTTDDITGKLWADMNTFVQSGPMSVGLKLVTIVIDDVMCVLLIVRNESAIFVYYLLHSHILHHSTSRAFLMKLIATCVTSANSFILSLFSFSLFSLVTVNLATIILFLIHIYYQQMLYNT